MRNLGIVWALVLAVLATGVASAQQVPGNTVEERAVNGAKAYLKKIGVDRLEQTMMMVSLFAKARKVRFTTRSSSEWNVMTTNRACDRSRRAAASRKRSRPSSS